MIVLFYPKIRSTGLASTEFGCTKFYSLANGIALASIAFGCTHRKHTCYVSVGNYTDVYFPDHDIRFIAVNDGIDSEDGESEIAPFKNILNENF